MTITSVDAVHQLNEWRQVAALAEEQLTAQERSLRKQLDEQRGEASKARYFEAIGAFVATVEAGRSAFTSVRD